MNNSKYPIHEDLAHLLNFLIRIGYIKETINEAGEVEYLVTEKANEKLLQALTTEK